ncbi:Asparagine-rich protein (ARP protein) [Exophiala sideris]|nr:Asparagine-rich protein (ARP protein) [Exophiala sideris]
MATTAPPTPKLDRYVVIHVATTCDEHGVYVTKDSAEVIELGWILLDTSLTTLTWEHVRNAGSFRDAVTRFDHFAQEHLTSKNLEFSFVTLDAWDLRVQLPREARDKAVVLPAYLQHSRTFDLRSEYARWQQHHPESLPFGPSSLVNICAALEVEPVQSSAPIKHNLPFHLQALAPASPRRAMEEAVTLARVLRGLIRKSQPAQEHPDVLTRPMDARADVNAFLKERSKVLHMNGLPHDTTQSELESWFTQFGGRPIAFWTLRTPDQHKPTGSGFAVFSSHEEAAESLCMNGRALNEKAIEVSPSSSRVLDRAAEILTPFPPTGSGGGDPYGGGYNAYGYGPPHMMGHHPHMGGHHGHGMGHHGRGGAGPVPFRAGDWRCGAEGCQYHNFAKNVNCLRCGAPRSGAAIVVDSSFPSPMGPPSEFGMGPGSMASTPGPAPYGAGGAAFGSGAAFAQPPPNQYGLPSGMGGPGAAFPQMGGMTPGYASSNMSHSSFGPAAQAAFSGAADNMAPGPQNGFYGNEQNADPFAFLSAGLGNLSVSDENQNPRRNGGPQSAKSPA